MDTDQGTLKSFTHLIYHNFNACKWFNNIVIYLRYEALKIYLFHYTFLHNFHINKFPH